MSAPAPLARRARRLALPLALLLALGAELVPAPYAAPAAQAQAAGAPFDQLSPLSGTLSARSAALGDVDLDGDLDLVLAGAAEPLLFRNEPGGQLFASGAPALAAPSPLTDIALADVNRDGYPDLVGRAGGALAFYLNQRAPTPFGAAPDAALAGIGAAAAFGDVSGDGFVDMVAITPGGCRLFVNNRSDTPYGGEGTLLFATDTAQTAGDIRALALADISRDGFLDLVVGYNQVFGESLNTPNKLYVHNRTDVPYSGLGTPIGRAETVAALAVGDINGDGFLDLVQGNSYVTARGGGDDVQRNRVYLHNGTDSPFPSGVMFGGARPNVSALALGDVDGDGDLDLVQTALTGSSLLFLNDGTNDPFKSSVAIGGQRRTTGLALGDVDGDGDLDLVRTNILADAELALNDATQRPFPGDGVPASELTSASAVALADLDRNGFLDLILGAFDGTKIYLSDAAGAPFAGPSSAAGGGVRALAAGDMNGDGYPDLVTVTNTTLAVYLNNHTTTPFPAASYHYDGSGFFPAVLLGDVDGSGSLDIVIVQNHGGLVLILNDGGASLSLREPQRVAGYEGGLSAALGDVDGDGDLDVVVGISGQAPTRVYLNTGGPTPFDGSSYGVGSPQATMAVVLADIDGDEDLDLLQGIDGQPTRLFVNDGSARPFSDAGRAIGGARATTALVAGDVDGDGDLDLLQGNSGAPAQVFTNSGEAFPFGAPGIPVGSAQETTALAAGDVDGDGDLDIVQGNGIRPWESAVPRSRLYRNTRFVPQRLPNSPPTVSFAHPERIDRAAFYGSPTRHEGAVVQVPFVLADAEGDTVRRVRGFYSLDGGGSWRAAVPADATALQNLPTSPSGVAHSFAWDIGASGVVGESDAVVFRLLAEPAQNAPRAAATPAQQPFVSATSFPFRLRGILPRVVTPDGAPVQGALVYALVGTQSSGAQPLPSRRAADPQLGTGPRGFLYGRGTLAVGDRLVALQEVGRTAKYTLYHTSAAPTASGLAAHTIAQPGVQTLTVSPDNALALLNLDVSLEWDARRDNAFRQRLRNDLLRASALLYDWSDGQIALGTVTVYHARQRWYDVRDANGRITQKGADVRVYATNRLRPSASQGGIVPQDTPDPDVPEQVYEPGPVHIGAVWNRDGSPAPIEGSDAWARALAHELGHYALFLDDNYLGLDAQGRLIAVDGCPGAMSDPYRDDYGELHPAAGWLPPCAQTLSQRSTGRADWQTVERFTRDLAPGFRLRPPAAFGANPGPSALPLGVTDVTFVERPETAPAAARQLPLNTPAGAPARLSGAARATLLRQDGASVTDLGQPVAGEVTAWGADTRSATRDRVCVFDLAAGQLGCAGAAELALIVRARPDWRPDVQITDVTSRAVTLVVPAASVGAPAPSALQARVIPSDSAQAPRLITLVKDESGARYRGSAAFDELVGAAAIHLWVPADPLPAGASDPPRREAVTEYALGGNPAPRRRPRPRSRRRSPMTSPDGSLVLFADATRFAPGQFFAIQTATALPADPPTATPIGPGYRLLVSDPALLAQPIGLTLSYAPGDYPPGTEAGIAVYYQPPGGAWQRLATTIDPDDNEVVAQAPGAGLYALMASLPWEIDRTGLQQVAYPGQDAPLPDALTPLRGRYTHLYGYDGGDADDPWKVFAPDAPAWVNDLAGLSSQQPYWVNVRRPLVAPVKPPEKVAVLPFPPALFYGVLRPDGDFVPRAGMEVQALIGGVVCATTATRQVGAEIVWSLDVPAATDIATKDCGATGRVVEFVVDGRPLPGAQPWDNELVNGRVEPDLFLPLVRR